MTRDEIIAEIYGTASRSLFLDANSTAELGSLHGRVFGTGDITAGWRADKPKVTVSHTTARIAVADFLVVVSLGTRLAGRLPATTLELLAERGLK